MKKLITRAAMVAFLATGVCGAASADDDATGRCTAETLRGTYVFSAHGFVIIAGVAQPKALIEVIDFNGDGTLVVSAATRSVGGVITRSAPSVGSYTVGADCAGTITFDGPTFDVFISPRGSQFWMIQTNPNSVFEGSATRTSRALLDGDQQ
jgi:hypothetical protein